MKKQGFTLIEVVIALALGAMILVASSQLLMSFTQLWLNEEKLDDFQDHVHGVSDFVERHLREGMYAVDESLPKVQWGSPPRGSLGIDESYLVFYVNTPHPLFETDKRGPVICYMTVKKDTGLVLVWHELVKEKELDREELRQVVLSPWVTQMKLHYYDDKRSRWDVDRQPRGGAGDQKMELPAFLEFVFEKEDEETQAVYVPVEKVNAKDLS